MQTDPTGFPKRPKKYPVGKHMSPKLYFHKSYLHLFPSVERQVNYIMSLDSMRAAIHDYTCIRWDMKLDIVSFQWCPTFDELDEPIVEDTLTVIDMYNMRPKKGGNLIWHHKWMWVQDDYEGFDVEESKNRSRLWLPHVPKEEKLKIGRLDYWDSIKHRWEGK